MQRGCIRKASGLLMGCIDTKNFPFHQYDEGAFLQGDCVEIMRECVAESSVDMVFADPPYNLQIQGKTLIRPNNGSEVDGVHDHWDQFSSYKAYDAFTKAWLKEVRRILKPTGTVWITGDYHNIFRVGSLLQDLNFTILNDIIWRKTNPMPNFLGRRFTNAHETILWAFPAKTSSKKYTFNYASMKTFNDDLQMRSDWLLPICERKERLYDQKGHKKHPTQKPEALLKRILLASTKQGDLVLDPFSGTGTTAAVAKMLKRPFISIDNYAPYIDMAKERCARVLPIEQEALSQIPSARDKVRIPFGYLLEGGYIREGHTLYDVRRRFEAVVRADSSISCRGIDGSIHKVGATLQGRPNCNGWSFWHIHDHGSLVVLDAIRERFRKERFPSALVA